MGAGRTEQFEGIRSCIFQNEDKPWKQRDSSNSRKFAKKTKHKRERRRAKIDPECTDEYRKYEGFEY